MNGGASKAAALPVVTCATGAADAMLEAKASDTTGSIKAARHYASA